MSQGVITYLRVSSADLHIFPTGYRLTPRASTINVLHVNSDIQGERTSMGYHARRNT